MPKPCTACPVGKYKSKRSSFGCSVGAAAYASCRKYLPEALLGGGWRLVRHLPAGSTAWHPAVDHLEGTETYGNSSDDSVAFSIPFGNTTGELLFSGETSGDESMWLLTTKTAATGGDYYSNSYRDVIKSSLDDSHHEVQWYHENTNMHPAISLTNWWTATSNNQILYLGDSYGIPPAGVKFLPMMAPMHSRAELLNSREYHLFICMLH